jgi:hypothetical protein
MGEALKPRIRMEMVYQYYWQMCVKRGDTFRLVDGRDMTILSPGILNRDAGPDFFYAKLKINGEVWVGNVEVHTKASDWQRHRHSSDTAYDNVVLHVVAIDDARVTGKDGAEIAQLVVTPPHYFFSNINAVMNSRNNYIKCAASLDRIDAIHKKDWLTSLSGMRMQAKAARITAILERFSGDWQQTCFVALATALGFNLNNAPFEVLASSIPLKILSHHSDSIFQLEALLFGRGGFLANVKVTDGDYIRSLQREYQFLATKYGFNALSGCTWKYARTRPANFPHRRIALLAAFCEGGFSLLSDILAAQGDCKKLHALFAKRVSRYWQSHYSFSSAENNIPVTDENRSNGGLSPDSLDLICINMIAPLYYAYGLSTGKKEYLNIAANIWDSIPEERNTITRSWRAAGITADNAAESQALIHLYKEFCINNRCADCRFFYQLMRRDMESGS